jgi:hypothetical protein
MHAFPLLHPLDEIFAKRWRLPRTTWMTKSKSKAPGNQIAAIGNHLVVNSIGSFLQPFTPTLSVPWVSQTALNPGYTSETIRRRRSEAQRSSDQQRSVPLFDGGRTTDPEPEAVVTEVRRKVDAEGGAAIPRRIASGPAAHHAGALFSAFPGRTVSRGAFVASVPRILAPFPNVAVHVV